MAHLDPTGYGQLAATVGAKIIFVDHPDIALMLRSEIATGVNVEQVLVDLVGSGDEIDHLGHHSIDNQGNF